MKKKNESTYKSLKKNYKQISIMVRKEFAEEIEKRVKERNISKQKYIVELIRKDLNQT